MKKSIPFIIIILSFAGISSVMKDDGRAGATASPGEPSCNTSNCHVGNAINTSSGSIQIVIPTMTGQTYSPGQTYPVEVTVERMGNSLFGFGFEALRTTGANGGLLSITNPSQTQIKSASVGGNLRTNVVHQLNGGATSNSHTFTFNWTAPAQGTGNVTMYTAGNAANGNGSAAGDFIYTTSLALTESTVGIEEVNPYFGNVNTYPNPVKDHLIMTFDLKSNSPTTISLLDINGKKYHLDHQLLLPGIQNIKLPISNNISSGVFIIQIENKESSWYKKVVVVK